MAKPIQAGAKYQVKQGDAVESIAAAAGHLAETIWDAPENKGLKKKRKSPDLLLPGDELFIPEKKSEEAKVKTGQEHAFEVKRPPLELKLRLEQDGKPRANQPFTLEAGGLKQNGKTDGDGWVKAALPAGARQALLAVGEGEERTELVLELRSLDPVDELSGLQARLANLGYGPVPQDGKMGPETEAALRHFQHDQGLDPSGKLDKPTQDKLVEAHGS